MLKSSLSRLVLIFVLSVAPSITFAEMRVLVLGDSNTWGSNASGGRYDDSLRWGRVIDSALDDVLVIEEGRIGRRTDFFSETLPDNIDHPVSSSLPELIATHLPLNLVVIMLGTNDLQAGLNRSAHTIARSVFSLARIVKAGGVRNVLVVTPPPLSNPQQGNLGYLFGDAESLSEELAEAYKDMSLKTGIPVFDAGEVTRADGRDGVHLSAAAHKKLGLAISQVVADLIQ